MKEIGVKFCKILMTTDLHLIFVKSVGIVGYSCTPGFESKHFEPVFWTKLNIMKAFNDSLKLRSRDMFIKRIAQKLVQSFPIN